MIIRNLDLLDWSTPCGLGFRVYVPTNNIISSSFYNITPCGFNSKQLTSCERAVEKDRAMNDKESCQPLL